MRAKQVYTKLEKYTFNQHNEAFLDEASVLAHIFKCRYPNGLLCEKCTRFNMWTPIEGRRAYACPCGFHISPTADTIFHKSSTSLKTWYFAIFLLSNAKNGLAALELQHHIGTTYKTAWRMCHQIPALMGEEVPYMTSTVEVDETYIGCKRPGKRGRGAAGKTAIVAALERGGNALPVVVENTNA